MKLTFPSVLFLIFLVLKLTGHIDWSWWWVSAPLWLDFIIFFVALLVIEVAKEVRRGRKYP